MPRAAAEETVGFTVLCRPKSGESLEEFRKKLNLETVKKLIPDEATREQVIGGLRAKGFTVYAKHPSPVVSARGTVTLFEQVFKTRLKKRKVPKKERAFRQDFYVVDPKAPPPDPEAIPGALLIFIPEPPQPFSWAPSPLPPSHSSFHLRHPGDVAIVTKAALVHRQNTPSGQRATGEGVVLAVLDDGVYRHPFYVRNGYDLRIDKAEDVTDPADDDPDGHGTKHTVSVFSCAPDAIVYGIKMGADTSLSFALARAVSAKIISCSWGWNLDGETSLNESQLTMRTILLDLIADGITVVFSGGNIRYSAFPAMMPEVIAVGGASVDKSEKISAYNEGSSFVSAIFPSRAVPDLCGLASKMALPLSPPSASATSSWSFDHGRTSNAAPQVAGIIALLLQKNPTLTPAQVKDALLHSATDIDNGTTSTGSTAVAGVDLATGYGLVNAMDAWSRV